RHRAREETRAPALRVDRRSDGAAHDGDFHGLLETGALAELVQALDGVAHERGGFFLDVVARFDEVVEGAAQIACPMSERARSAQRREMPEQGIRERGKAA